MKRIKLELTEDQVQFLINVTEEYLNAGIHEPRLAFARRLRTELIKAKS